MSLTTHLMANATGKRYSYAFRARGLPVVWTDGRGTWTAADMSLTTPHPAIQKGGLLKTGWSFDFESNPLEPLEVGGGITVELGNDMAGVTRRLFAPTIDTLKWYTTAVEFGADEATVSFQDAAGVIEDVPYYIGLETVHVTDDSAAPSLVLDRGCYGSLARRITPYFDGAGGAYETTTMTNYPTVWRGRYCDIWMGEVLDDGTIGDVWKVWAGRLEAFDITTKGVRLNIETLTAGISKDYWPRALGECSTGNDTLNIYVEEDQFYMRADAFATGARITSGLRYELGLYNAVGVWERVDNTARWLTLEQLVQMMNDTLVLIANVEFSSDIYNHFNVYVESGEMGDAGAFARYGGVSGAAVFKYIKYRNDTIMNFRIFEFAPFETLRQPFGEGFVGVATTTIVANGSGRVYPQAFANSGYVVDYTASLLQALPNNRRFYPSVNEGCKDVNDDMIAYVAISSGDAIELVAVDTILPDTTGTINMAVRERGLGGTPQRAWGVDGPITLKQVCAVRTGETMTIADVLLYLLTSVDGAGGGTNGTYDILGPATGLGIPEDLVDIQGIRSRLNIGDMPQPSMFWIEDAGKGKDVLENFMKMHGVYFVTRRFEADGGEQRFGLSVDVVDVPTTTKWNLTITDSHIAASEEPRVNINERLTINQVALSPRYVFGQDVQDTGGKRFAYAEASIRKYGAAKALEIEASALYNGFSSRFTGNYTDESTVATAIATAVSLRWFGAYADGNYTVSANMPHVGWAVQCGDRLLMDITNIANTDGSIGFSGVAKVMDVRHKHGSNLGAEVTVRVNVNTGVELAPAFRVASYSGSNITLTANAFSLTGDGMEPPFEGDTSPPRDAQWFDYVRHGSGSGLTLTVWEQGNYAGRVTRTVTATAGNVLTLSSSLGATLQGIITTGNVPVIGTFGDYATPISELRAGYAYVGTNDTPSVIGDGTGIEAPARRWF